MRSPAIALIVTAALAGCGGAGGAAPTATDGKTLFAGTCGTCHTLADAGTTGTFGPNLDELAPDSARVLRAIAGGPGAMPAGLLEGARARAVAAYVAKAAGR